MGDTGPFGPAERPMPGYTALWRPPAERLL
jgi:hypothetical protein